MSKRWILGEAAGLCWLCADASWAIGDRLQWHNTGLMAGLFAAAIILGLIFIYATARGAE